MGNYLLSLRVPPPPPEEDERNHPDYYDWTIPKWQPFKMEPSREQATVTPTTTTTTSVMNHNYSGRSNNGQLLADSATSLANKSTATKSPAPIPKTPSASRIPVSGNKQTSGAKQTKASTPTGGQHNNNHGNNSNDLKVALTAPVVKKVTPSAAATSSSSAAAAKSQIAKSTSLQAKSSTVTATKTIKPETIDTKKAGDIETQSAIMAASNVHTAKGNEARAKTSQGDAMKSK